MSPTTIVAMAGTSPIRFSTPAALGIRMPALAVKTMPELAPKWTLPQVGMRTAPAIASVMKSFESADRAIAPFRAMSAMMEKQTLALRVLGDNTSLNAFRAFDEIGAASRLMQGVGSASFAVARVESSFPSLKKIYGGNTISRSVLDRRSSITTRPRPAAPQILAPVPVAEPDIRSVAEDIWLPPVLDQKPLLELGQVEQLMTLDESAIDDVVPLPGPAGDAAERWRAQFAVAGYVGALYLAWRTSGRYEDLQLLQYAFDMFGVGVFPVAWKFTGWMYDSRFKR